MTRHPTKKNLRTAMEAQAPLSRNSDINDLVQLVGVEAVQTLLTTCGGMSVYIPTPERMADSHWLVVALGWDKAALIADRYAGDRLSLPLVKGNRARVWSELNRGIQQGLSVPELVRRTGLHERTIRRHRNSHTSTDTRQFDLFDRS